MLLKLLHLPELDFHPSAAVDVTVQSDVET